MINDYVILFFTIGVVIATTLWVIYAIKNRMDEKRELK